MAEILCDCCKVTAADDGSLPGWDLQYGSNGPPWRVCPACVASRPKPDPATVFFALNSQRLGEPIAPIATKGTRS
jgi:hypothetical protein